ncbi:MAG TPA: ferrous iron transport protein B [Vicinamibacterales bacterium]|nr:ferrous iron transport protein B [Vicinamibacterales bacterium]
MNPLAAASACHGCAHRGESLIQLGVVPGRWDYLVALAGNPNTGKSTVFNALTGLRQHTGNWPGKTVARAEGTFRHGGKAIKIVDLPGTYSLQAASTDEEVARDFLLFGRPDVTVVVIDATRLERNLNLALQVLEITDRVVVVLNLMDEARRHGIGVNTDALARELGVPVIPAAARQGTGIGALRDAILQVATGAARPQPHRLRRLPADVESPIAEVLPAVEAAYPDTLGKRWVALRLLNGDERVLRAVPSGELGAKIVEARWRLPGDFQDRLTGALYAEAERIARASEVTGLRRVRVDLDKHLDRLLTSRWTGFPLMVLLLAVVFWLTIAGANVPSSMLASLLLDDVHPVLKGFGAAVGMPWWMSGFLFDGMYLATAWVVSVMLPPMAIFFPLFTLLEDFGYLPRVAFNMDRMFQRVGAHGKQALTMCMGFGCNAAGVVATRVIDSPRERLVAIITNNFSLCNGRWPTQILIASIFLGTLVPAHLAGITAAGAVVAIALLGVFFMFAVSWGLTRSVLKGEATTFSLELPPYRPPRILQTLYTSLIDRTAIVLWRAVVFALPAGAAIWLISNVHLGGGASIAATLVSALDPVGVLIGLNGVILLAYVVAIPANEIVIPTILMLTVHTLRLAGLGAGDGVMFELDDSGAVRQLLVGAGWTTLTGINLMLFSLLHNPCSTTIYTIYKETGSARWTAVATLLPLALGVSVCFLVAQVWRLLF